MTSPLWSAVVQPETKPFRSHRWLGATLYRDGREVCVFPEAEEGEGDEQREMIEYMVAALNAAADEVVYTLAPTLEECA